MSKEYIKQLEEANEKLKVQIEVIQKEKEAVEEKWRTHEISDDSEMWSLDYTIACFILPRLKKLKETKNGYPSELESPEAWAAIMQKMIDAFEAIVNDDRYPAGCIKQKEIIESGLKLFAEHFQSLWD
jgi:hypothetical protein